MQFAMINTKTHPILLDAVEWQFIKNKTPLEDEPVHEDAFSWHIVYGAFLPLEWPTHSAEYLKTIEGCGFGRITDDGKCRMAELRKIEIL